MAIACAIGIGCVLILGGPLGISAEITIAVFAITAGVSCYKSDKIRQKVIELKKKLL